MKIPHSFSTFLEDYLKEQIVSMTPVKGGDISHALRLKCENGQQYFLKWREPAPLHFFRREAEGLTALARCSCIRVPQVVCHADASAEHPAFILLEYLESGAMNRKGWKDFGKSLAKLHQITGDHFGWECDNFIGLNPQRNRVRDTWSDFFLEERIEAQFEIALVKGWFTQAERGLLTAKKEIICRYLDADKSPPALVHGDLWSGNVYWSNDGPVLIDPAVYYGSPEADIAMTEMFGGFPPEFYQSYRKERPLEQAYEKRKSILNFYHLLNHANLFGGSYVREVREVLAQLG